MKIRNYKITAYRIIIFFLTTIIIIALFPSKTKFKYQYTKETLWRYKNLTAPFDFPILKTKQEIQKEQEKLLKTYTPYYLIDTNTQHQQIRALAIGIEQLWKDIQAQPTLAQEAPSKETVYQIIKQQYTHVYQRGIIPNRNEIQDYQTINIIKNNKTSVRSTSELYSPLQAYQHIKKELTLHTKINQSYLQQFIQDLELNNYIKPNLIYDSKTSEYEKEKLFQEVSTSRGLIQTGELIIAKGELITPQKYNLIQSLQKEFQKQAGSTNHILITLGQMLLITVSMLCLFLYIVQFAKPIYRSSANTIFILLLIILFTLLTRTIINIQMDSTNNSLHYIIPYIILPVIVKTFFGNRTALFIHIINILIVAYMVPNAYKFIFLQLITGYTSILINKKIYYRKDLFLISIHTFIIYSIIYFAMSVIEEGTFEKIEWSNYLWFALNALLILIAYPLIYIFERTFKFLSNITLLELSDTNRPLLRKLAQTAAGTFQHSIMVANLAEEIIQKIGGNPLLVRTAALYHDIGKMKNPQYFIENQGGGHNPHNDIEYDQSAKIIIQHVADGIEMAKKQNIPKQLIQFIATHHGTTKVLYFYRSFMNKYPDASIDIEQFTYPGPKPNTKETAALMMADAIEAASRPMKEKTQENLHKLVDDIINYQIKEEQYSNAPITFQDIERARETLKNKLTSIYHARIEYPEEKK